MLLLVSSFALGGLPSVDAPLKTGAKASGDAAVVIGIEDYFALPPVPHARRDADAFYKLLVYTVGVPASRVRLLNGKPAKEQIVAAVEEAAKEASGGRVWIYFAGHGAASPTDGRRLLLGADVQSDLTMFDARSVPVDALAETVSGKGASPVMVLDTCYSGKGRAGADLVPGKRFAVPTYAAKKTSDKVEWTAASSGEWSGPLDAASHGAFTYLAIGALRGWADGQIDGTRDGKVTAEEAQLYVQESLGALQLRDQHPVLTGAGSTVLSKGTESGPTLDATVSSGPAPAPAPVAPPAAVPAGVTVVSQTASKLVLRAKGHSTRGEAGSLMRMNWSKKKVAGMARDAAEAMLAGPPWNLSADRAAKAIDGASEEYDLDDTDVVLEFTVSL